MDLDAELPGIVGGDEQAFGRFLGAAELSVRAGLRSFAARVDVEAVMQESALRLWQVAPRFVADGSPNGLARLWMRIAQNLALDEVKRRRELLADDDAALAPTIDVAPPDPLLRRLIHACFEALPDRPGAALRARLESEGAEPDLHLAARLEMRLNTFLQNITRAKKLLAACLREKGVALTPEAEAP
jgi:DNA-directed RNA polymerase specialized sigma24 family protein